MDRFDDDRFTEVDLIRLLEQIIERDPTLQPLRTRGNAEGWTQFDMMLERDNVLLVVEVKRVAPQTTARFQDVMEQLRSYRRPLARRFPDRLIRLVLAIPGVLTRDKVKMLVANGFELWDREWIIGHAIQVGLLHEVRRMFGDVAIHPLQRSLADKLQFRLEALSCGRTQWYRYQKLCGDILEYLFCPPLNTPITESSNVPRINRRDLVVPNYVPDGFWYFMRQQYHADYVVIDAKNHCGQTNKTHVLQLANYLSSHGTGLFGIIITRKGMDRAASTPAASSGCCTTK